MQTPALPPEIPKRSLAPVWLTLAALVIAVVAWGFFMRPSQQEWRSESGARSPAAAANAVSAPPVAAADPPPPPPPPEHAPPRPVGAIPAEATGVSAPPAAAAPRDPNCDGPCKGRETPELLAAMRTKAGQARSCYERALSNDSALAGKLELAVRVGADGSACSSSVANDSLGDVSVKSCALARFRGAKFPKPVGGCVNVSVPMNFMPAGSP
jgi:hypothetical protein